MRAQTWAQVRMRENPAMAAKDLIRGLNRRQDRLEWLQETTVFWKGPQNTVKNVILGNVAWGLSTMHALGHLHVSFGSPTPLDTR